MPYQRFPIEENYTKVLSIPVFTFAPGEECERNAFGNVDGMMMIVNK